MCTWSSHDGQARPPYVHLAHTQGICSFFAAPSMARSLAISAGSSSQGSTLVLGPPPAFGGAVALPQMACCRDVASLDNNSQGSSPAFGGAVAEHPAPTWPAAVASLDNSSQGSSPASGGAVLRRPAAMLQHPEATKKLQDEAVHRCQCESLALSGNSDSAHSDASLVAGRQTALAKPPRHPFKKKNSSKGSPGGNRQRAGRLCTKSSG